MAHRPRKRGVRARAAIAGAPRMCSPPVRTSDSRPLRSRSASLKDFCTLTRKWCSRENSSNASVRAPPEANARTIAAQTDASKFRLPSASARWSSRASRRPERSASMLSNHCGVLGGGDWGGGGGRRGCCCARVRKLRRMRARCALRAACAPTTCSHAGQQRPCHHRIPKSRTHLPQLCVRHVWGRLQACASPAQR